MEKKWFSSPSHPPKLLQEKRVGFLLCFSLTRVRQHYTNRNRSSLRFLLCLSSWRLKLSSSYNISSLGRTISGSRLVPICWHLTDSQLCQYLKTLNFKRKTFQVKSTAFGYSIRSYNIISHILKIKYINEVHFPLYFSIQNKRGKIWVFTIKFRFYLKKKVKKVPKPKTQITAFPFNRSVLIDFITYKSFRTKGKGGYLGYILFLQPLFVFFNRPCSFFPFPPRLAFNTVLFSHTACLALPLSICSQGFLPSFSLSLLKPEAVCFKSVTSSLSLDLSIGILNSTTRYMCLSLGNDTLYALDPQLPSHSRRHQTAAARFYGNVFLLLRETHPWHFWRSRWADFLDFLFTAAAKCYSLVTLMLLLIAQQIKQPFLACYQSPCTKSSAPSSLRRMKNLHTTILQAQAIQGHSCIQFSMSA